MKNIFIDIKKTIKTELIKKKRSGIFTLSIIIGTFLPIIGFIIQVVMNLKGEKVAKGIPVSYYYENLTNYLIPFTYFFFPILMIYCASKIAQIDHKNKGWHLMETLPVTKLSVYLSKYLLLLTSNLIAITSLLISTLFFGFLITVFFEIPIDKLLTIPFLNFIEIGLRLFAISICLSALQYAISVLLPSFIWPIIIGFVTMIVPLALENFSIVLNWYPHQLLHQVASYPEGSDFGCWFTYSELSSVLYTVIFLYIGFNWFRFKTFFKAFFSSKKQLLRLTGVLFFVGTTIYFTLKPKHQNIVDKTVITGIVSTDKSIKNIYIFDGSVGDTLANISVKDNKFKHQFSENIKADHYTIQFDNYSKKTLFFGAKDSINLSYKLFGRKEELKIKGTRIAENIQSRRRNYSFSLFSYYLEENRRIDDENYYMEAINEEWKDNLVKIKTIRTVDNLVPRKDYITRQKKIVTLRYLKFWNDYKKKRSTLFPNKKYTVSKEMKELEESLSLTDETLLSNLDYLNYILEELIKNDKREISQNQKYFSAIEKMNPSLFKDRLLFTQLNKSLSESNKVEVRDSLMQKYITSITKSSYKKLLQKNYFKYNRLTKGAKAPGFIAFDGKGEIYTLDSFKGKVVIIDCWATWCGPCKREEPYYQRKALAYKNKAVQFISMNSDKSKKDWLVDIKDKGNSILHLRPEDIKQFGELYAINSIPRFILIDAEGNFLNSEFVRPSSKFFDELLKVHL